MTSDCVIDDRGHPTEERQDNNGGRIGALLALRQLQEDSRAQGSERRFKSTKSI